LTLLNRNTSSNDGSFTKPSEISAARTHVIEAVVATHVVSPHVIVSATKTTSGPIEGVIIPTRET